MALRAVYNTQRSGQLSAASQPLELALEFARRYPLHPFTAKTIEYSAFRRLIRFQYTDAIREYLNVRRLSQVIGDQEVAANAMNSLANVYLAMDNFSSALVATEAAVAALPAHADPAVRIVLETNRARMLVRMGRRSDAESTFRPLLRQAESVGSPQLQADVWKVIARAHAAQERLREAEAAIRTALELRRRAGGEEVAADLADLAAIQLDQGDGPRALASVEEARTLVTQSPRLPPWKLDFLAARSHLAARDPEQALRLMRRACQTIENMPAYTLPGDSLRSSIGYSSQIYETFVEAAELVFRRTAQPGLLAEAFAVAESGRAAALRQGAPGLAVPPAAAERYWELVRQLNESSGRMMNGDTQAPESARHEQLRLELAELEAGFDQNLAPRRATTPAGPGALRPGEAAILFQLGERKSWVWALVHGQPLALHSLPPAERLNTLVAQWSDLPAGPDRQAHAHRLYQTLFGKLSLPVQQARRWVVALDGELFRAPLAALVVAQGAGRPIYLAERHILQTIPGAWALTRRRPLRSNGLFLGVGDPIYNGADPRLGSSKRAAPSAKSSAAVLPRLPGSAAELEACVRASNGPRTLLTGATASQEQVAAQLKRAPAVVHLALHVVPDPATSADNLVALSLNSRGAPELIGPEWIAAQSLPGSFVFMNGCRSGTGTVSRTEGLLGLTRGWLRAGASRVLSTYWPTRDDGGQFASEFYRHRARLADEAEALHQTQVAMIALGGWQADPDYWAAYFLIGYPPP
ncbi:MAG: CHAT domain-containing protein [Bryobacterales bacterium]|nr:CHAT domain-containing protein [Bryobacterales bacterium]